MKKLIALAAAATCGAALAVESANIVGYQNKSLATGSNAFVCQTILPMNTAAEAVTLGDILPTDGADGWAYDTDFLATLKPNGNKNASYGYLSPYWANKYFEDEQAGWYDLSVCQDEEFDGATKKNSTVIPFGTGVLVYTSGSGVTVTFAGEVKDEEVALGLATGSNSFVGNASPVDLTLGDLLPTGGADGWAYDTDFLATLKPNGNKDASYGYLSPYWANKYFEDEQAGWYYLSVCQDEEFDGATKKNDVQIPAGQAFLVYTAGSGIELVVPSPL